jgi:hypothetical protein
MILEAYNVLNKQYSLVTAWNWKKFDGIYLVNRTRKLKLKAKLFPIQEMDAMLNYKKLTIWGFMGAQYKLECAIGITPILSSNGYIPLQSAATYFTGMKDCYMLKSGNSFLIASWNHPILTPEGFRPLFSLSKGCLIGKIKNSQEAIMSDPYGFTYTQNMRELWEAIHSRSERKEILFYKLQSILLLQNSKPDEQKGDPRKSKGEIGEVLEGPYMEEEAWRKHKKIKKVATAYFPQREFRRTNFNSLIGTNENSIQEACEYNCARYHLSGGLFNWNKNSNGNHQKCMVELSESSTSNLEEDCSAESIGIFSIPSKSLRHYKYSRANKGNIEYDVVDDVIHIGVLPTFDISVYPYHNYVAAGIICHNTVAKRHLGIDHESMKSKMDAERLWSSFIGDKKELREYNLMDARLVVMLDDLLKLSEPYIDIAQQFPIMLRDAPLMSMVLETILLKETAKSSPRLVFPNREHKTANLIGGFTMQPKPGVHRGVLSLDYKSLYPTTMATFKLSPELVMLYKSWKDSGLDFDQWVERAFRRGM